MPAEAVRSVLLLNAFPCLQVAVLVMEAEEPTWEPPLDGPPEGSAPAPAIWITPTLAISWIVNASDETAIHVPILAL